MHRNSADEGHFAKELDQQQQQTTIDNNHSHTFGVKQLIVVDTVLMLVLVFANATQYCVKLPQNNAHIAQHMNIT